MRTWFIYRGQHFLAAFHGTLEQAEEFAYEQFGIGCAIVRGE